MNFKNKLNQIRVVLGMEVKLASETLVDGTVVEAEAFEPGYPVFVVTEEGNTPAPAGEHETDSLKIVVDEEGKIVSVEEKSSEEASVDVEVEAQEEEVEVKVDAEEHEDEPKIEMEDVAEIKEAMQKVVMAVEEVVSEMAEIKEEVKMMKEKYAKFAKEPAGEKFKTLTSEEFAAIDAEDKVAARVAALKNLKGQGFFKKH
jgi:hypothetical protein